MTVTPWSAPGSCSRAAAGALTSPLTRGLHSLTATETDRFGNPSVSSSPPLVLNIVAATPSSPTAKDDFNGDGYSDILWQHTNSRAALGAERNQRNRGEAWSAATPGRPGTSDGIA